MKLEDLGYNDQLKKTRKELKLDGYELGRVVAEHKERYIVKNEKGDFEAEITGNLRFTAKNREELPAVGDWVAMTTYEDDFAVIHQILPRFSTIKRQAVGQISEVQMIAANVDYAFLVQAVARDFNINRMERYLAICYHANIKPIIVLSKIDLIQESRLMEISEEIRSRIQNVPVVAISNETLNGYEAILSLIEKGKSYCLLGSSGVGKSTLLNNLSGKVIMKTASISLSTNKGKHITSHRELIILDNGGILIDNPGMREVGIADAGKGLEITFDAIYQYAPKCRFKDCTHAYEAGCAVIEAVHDGEIDHASYRNWLRMDRERAHYESSAADRRKKEKDFGKIMKNYKKEMKKNLYES
jgi:ribosome biogenesis GTPase